MFEIKKILIIDVKIQIAVEVVVVVVVVNLGEELDFVHSCCLLTYLLTYLW